MSISSLSAATTSTVAADNSAKVQLERDGRKAAADKVTAAAETSPATAETTARTVPQGSMGNAVDMYL